MSKMDEKERMLEQLTNLAMEAATQGRWDSVAQLYDRRAQTGFLGNVSQDVANKLVQLDRWIMARIREVQALAKQQLGESQQHLRQLEGLKRRWAGQDLSQTRHRLSI